MISKLLSRLLATTLLLMLGAIQPLCAEELKYELSPSSRTIMRTSPDQTLSMLVKQIYPQYRDLWPQLEREIRTLNPHAFNRYTGKIVPGERITLLTIKRIRETEVTYVDVVGTVLSVQGNVLATDKRGNERTLLKDQDILQGDRISTAADSIVTIQMVDEAELRIKPETSLRISEYVMKSGFETGSRSIIDLIRGGLRKLTGSIGANPLSVYQMKTGVATIGVRGTDYVVKLCAENDCEQSAGRNDSNTRLHVVVLDGAISLQDTEGVVGELVMGQYAVATRDTKVIVPDGDPVKGLLNIEERVRYNEIKFEPEEASGSSIWPWIIGGALLGL